jgi:hypothetical protein
MLKTVIWTTMFCVSVAVLGGAESTPRQQTTGGTPAKVPIVAATGCLTQTADGGWRLANATDTVVEPPQRRRRLNNDNAPVAPVALEKPAQTSGKNTYVLLGLDEFNPAAHKGHVVTIKGLFITAGAERRINVTVLHMVAAEQSQCVPS